MSSTPGEFTGRHMWFLVVGFFGVIAAVNIGMAVLASTSWTGLVVANSYVASQEFEEKRLAHNAQLADGWTSRFTYTPGLARLELVNGAGRPVELGPVTLTVNRPVGGHDDQSVLLEQTADGSYAAALTLDTGVWEALLQVSDTPKGPFELRERFSVEGN